MGLKFRRHRQEHIEEQIEQEKLRGRITKVEERVEKLEKILAVIRREA